MLRWTALLTTASLVAMALIDRSLGSRAEFLNAWSVVERLLGHPPSAGPSLVAERFGAAGELFVVLLANLAIGGSLAWVVTRFVRC